MKTYDWYFFNFADGYTVMARGMTKAEIKREESQHGKLIGKEYAGRQ